MSESQRPRWLSDPHIRVRTDTRVRLGKFPQRRALTVGDLSLERGLRAQVIFVDLFVVPIHPDAFKCLAAEPLDDGERFTGRRRRLRIDLRRACDVVGRDGEGV
jgi:hypothetical protein